MPGSVVPSRPSDPGQSEDGVLASQVRGVSEAIAATTVERRAELTVREVSLMQSDLRPSGAVYTRLYAAELGVVRKRRDSYPPPSCP